MYELRTPAPALRPFLEHYWFVTHRPGEAIDLKVDVFVDARADLIFNLGAPYVREVIGGRAAKHRRSNLDAQRLVPIRIVQRGLVRTSGVRFRLGGVGPFTELSLRAFTNLTPSPSAVFGRGAVALERALAIARSVDEQAQLLDAFFLERLRPDGGFAPFSRALSMLVETDGGASVDDIAGGIGVSPRHVERLFARYLGIPPKTIGRVLRFQRAMRALMRDPVGALADVAVDAGYFDQAHFVREFRRMSGGVPRGYRGYYPPQAPTDFAPNVVVFVQDARRRAQGDSAEVSRARSRKRSS